MAYEYLLIGRHGDVEDLKPVREVAKRLADTSSELRGSKWPVTVTAVEHAGTLHTRLTAEVYAGALGLTARVGDVALSPARFRPTRQSEPKSRPRKPTLDQQTDKTGKSAILLVGHEPAIDWLLDGWMNQCIALAKAEIACLAREVQTVNGEPDTWHLWWMLTPSQAAAIEPLRTKIGSKMTVLRSTTVVVVGAFITVAITIWWLRHKPRLGTED